MTSAKHHGYCLTINNWSPHEYEVAKNHIETQCTYGIIGKEVGESGTPHLQMYFHYANARVIGPINKKFPRAHIEYAVKDALCNQAYCSKGGDFIEHGTPGIQGTRTDIAQTKSLVDSGASTREVVQRATSYQSARMGQLLLSVRRAPPRIPPHVVWIYGPSGTGKTHRAMSMAGDDYWISGRDLRWFQGYCGQPTAVIDDFRADFCRFHELLRILDKYPYQVEIKGGSEWWVPILIIVTSCYSPLEVYKNKTDEDLRQLTRRINDVIQLTEVYVTNS